MKTLLKFPSSSQGPLNPHLPPHATALRTVEMFSSTSTFSINVHALGHGIFSEVCFVGLLYKHV